MSNAEPTIPPEATLTEDMNDDTLERLEKEVRKRKRIASEMAMALHDLVEDRLPAAYEELPALSRQTYQACQAWAEASARLAESRD